MSLYHMINGVSPCTFFVLPMLGKHPDEYPRFRDCFIDDEEHPEYENHIHVYTRTGGGNREEYELENQAMRDMPGFVIDFDDSFDNTYATWIFKVPEEFENDFKLVSDGKLDETSREYKDRVYEVYPKLKEKLKGHFKD